MNEKKDDSKLGTVEYDAYKPMPEEEKPKIEAKEFQDQALLEFDKSNEETKLTVRVEDESLDMGDVD